MPTTLLLEPYNVVLWIGRPTVSIFNNEWSVLHTFWL